MQLTLSLSRRLGLASVAKQLIISTILALCAGILASNNQGAEPAIAADRLSTAAKFGLDVRVPWTTSKIRGFPDPPPPLKLVRAYPKIDIPNLIALNAIPDSEYLLAVDHQSDWGGPSRIVQFKDTPEADRTELFLERPEIVYGLAFHPQFASNRYVFVGCNGRSDELDAVATRVLRFKVQGEGPFACDPDSATVIIEWKSNGHNGGDLAFDSDGMLFVSAGDGTSDSDQNRTGQDVSTLAGSMLRIDVDHPQAPRLYSVPTDNPFISLSNARPEIWAYGLRNPWRVCFDRESNQLWVGNNGQDLWESVYLIQRGANYGWSINESNHAFHTEQDHGPAEISAATAEHHHSEARSLTGGQVYRGSNFSMLTGAYVYGDFSTGNIWAIRIENGQQTLHQQIARSSLQITGFGFDTQGEILIADHQGGIYRFATNDAQQDDLFPRRLSQTGLFDSVAGEIALPGLIPYSVNSPLWSDNAVKRRWMAVPGDETIGYKSRGAWDFPEGSVLVKSFAFPSASDGTLRRIETRLMAKQQGQWYGYSYRWNAEQTDAFLVEAGGRDELLDGVLSGAVQGEGEVQGEHVNWRYPSRSECMVCHSRAADFVLGLSSEQMNRMHTYNATGTEAPQIETLAHIGILGGEDIEIPTDHLVDPMNADAGLGPRARSYLHSNCASCHVVSGGGNSSIVLSYFVDLEQTHLLNAQPLHGSLGLFDARLVRPGDPANSILLKRISTRGAGQMPPLATHLVDSQAVQLLADWIASLDTGDQK